MTVSTPEAQGAVPRATVAATLRGAIGRSGFFTLAFGAVVGSGWVIVLGDWLNAAGPAGAVLGFLAGGLVMVLIALCYGELAARSPMAGGEFLYTLQTLGRFPAFLVGWFLTLFGVSVCAFEAIALAWLLRALIPSIELAEAYRAFGSPVTWDALLIGSLGAFAIGALHARGAGAAIRFQNIVTFGFIAASVALIAVGAWQGSGINLQPLVAAPADRSWIAGAFWIFATSVFFLNGWQAALHAIEERRADVPMKSAISYIVVAILAAALFYCGIVLSAASLVPWPGLIEQELPAAAAFRSIGTGVLGTVIIVAAAVSLTKTWSAIAWIASRLLFAQARHGFLPSRVAQVNPASGSPTVAVAIVTALSLVGVALGRGAILPIVNMVSICLALSILLCLLVLLRRRRAEPAIPSFTVPGGRPVIVIALFASLAMITTVILEPILNGNGEIPLEWLLLAAWTVIGAGVWLSMGRARRVPALMAGCSVALVAVLGMISTPDARAQSADRAAPPRGPQKFRATPNTFIAMRDGVRLATDLYIPKAAPGDRFPVVLMRTPYGNFPGSYLEGSVAFFASHGYAVAVQDKRGKYRSEGVYTVSGGDAEDGYDTVDWLSKQPWSNGRVGTYGCSYLGDVQIFMAQTKHPALKAMIPQASGSAAGSIKGFYRYFGLRVGGALDWAAAIGWFADNGQKIYPKLPATLGQAEYTANYARWNRAPKPAVIDYRRAWYHLPMKDALRDQGFPASDFEDNITHALTDAYWSKFPYMTDAYTSDVPALFVNSWYDFGAHVTLMQFNHFREHSVSESARASQYAIMSPHVHCASEYAMSADTLVGSRPLGDTRFEYWDTYLTWFDHWLKQDPAAGRRIAAWPKLRYFLMGENRWKTAESWPPRGTGPVKYYLASGGKANSLFGDGILAAAAPTGALAGKDTFVYDPASPVPSLGGAMCCTGTQEAKAGGEDQRAIEARHDVLVYSSEPLSAGMEVTGTVEIVLYVSSSAIDTDFTAKLVDVYPGGRAFNVLESIRRARYREGFDREVWMKPGQVYEVRIPLGATGNYFGPGHRIRIEVSSSNFPRFDRNLNVGGNNAEATRWVVATNQVHHTAQHPSHIVLPVAGANRSR